MTEATKRLVGLAVRFLNLHTDTVPDVSIDDQGKLKFELWEAIAAVQAEPDLDSYLLNELLLDCLAFVSDYDAGTLPERIAAMVKALPTIQPDPLEKVRRYCEERIARIEKQIDAEKATKHPDRDYLMDKHHDLNLFRDVLRVMEE